MACAAVSGCYAAGGWRLSCAPLPHKDVLALNKACHECNVSKISRKAPQGLLQPVEVPLQIAQSYNIDRIGPFPESKNGNHMLMITVDRFSRWVWLEALKVSCTSEQFADLEHRHVAWLTRQLYANWNHTIRSRIVRLAIWLHHGFTAAAAACVHGPGGLGCRDRDRSMHAEQYVGMVAGWLY